MRPKVTRPMRLWLIAGVVGLLVSGSVSVAAREHASRSLADGANKEETTSTRPEIGTWPDDVDGDGWVSDRGDERIPDLIRAIGDHGVVGYVRFEDLEGPQPSSPEEAVAMSDEERTIPVYAEDGVTVVDDYTITASDDHVGSSGSS